MNYSDVADKSALIGESNDCAVKAVSIVTDVPYEKVHNLFADIGRKPNGRVSNEMIIDVLDNLGYKQEEVRINRMIVSSLSKELKSSSDKYIYYINGHIGAVTNGVVQDWTAGRRFHVKSLHKIVRRNDGG